MTGDIIQETKLRAVLLRHENRPNYQVAAMAGIAPSRLSEYALGRRRIPPHHLIRLCEILNCSADDILGEVEPRSVADIHTG